MAASEGLVPHPEDSADGTAQWWLIVSVHGQSLARPDKIATIAGEGPSDEHARIALDLQKA
jgi:hypothetical protein